MPDLYFPDSLSFQLGFTESREWRTVVLGGPTGLTQSSPKQFKGKRGIESLTVLNADVVAGSSVTSRDRARTMREFLDLAMGMSNWFWIFNPIAGDYQDNRIKVTVVGGVCTNLPIVLPYRGGATPVKISVAFATPVLDQGGTGGEWRITALDVSAAADGTYNSQWEFIGAQERIKVKQTTDREAWTANWDSVDTPTMVTLGVQEHFGA